MNLISSIDSIQGAYKRTTAVELTGHAITVYRDDATGLLGHLGAAEGMIFVARCDDDVLVVGQTADNEPHTPAHSNYKHSAFKQLALIGGVADLEMRATVTRALHQHLASAGVTVTGEAPRGGGGTVLQYDTARAFAGSTLVQLLHAGLLPRGLRPADLLSGPQPAAVPQDLYDAVDAAADPMLLNGWAVRAIRRGNEVIMLPGSELWVSTGLGAGPERADMLMPLIHHGRVVPIGGWVYRLGQPVLFDSLDDAADFAMGGLAKAETWGPAQQRPLSRMEAGHGGEGA